MKLVDLNVLLYAINADAVHHAPVRGAWERLVSGDEPVGLPWVVVLGFLRLTTHPQIFPRPLRTDDAIARVEGWLRTGNVRIVGERPEHWEILRGLLAESGSAGNLTTDAHLAALAISHGATLVSCDADFARFRGLRWESPLAERS